MHPGSLRCSSFAYRRGYAALVAPRDPGASSLSVRDRTSEKGYLGHRLEPPQERRLGQGAHDAVDLPPVLEHNQRRNALHS